MTLTLRSGAAEATLLPHRGGLLSQLTLASPKGAPVRLLWLSPDFSEKESGWPGGGLPVLFPFAGRVFHEHQPLRYMLDGQLYHMPLHGFAYGLPWETVRTDQASAELRLKASDRTTELYPFQFELTARYDLTVTGLKIELTAKHTGQAGRMPVAMGVHPYFHMPLGAASRLAECSLETSATTKIRVTPAGGAGKSTPFPENAEERSARLTDKLFSSLILAEHAKPEAGLVDHDSGLAVRIGWRGPVGYVVLWNQEGRGFQCVEPWMGLPDAVNNGQGIGWLAPGEEVRIQLEVRLEAL